MTGRCRNGHPRAIHGYVDRQGWRRCHACTIEKCRRYRAKAGSVHRDLTSNAELGRYVAAAVQRGDCTWSEIAREVGYMTRRRNGRTTVDTSRLQRALGVRRTSAAAGPAYGQVRMEYAKAVRVMKLVGADPVDVGL